MEKLVSFSLIHRKQKWTRTVRLLKMIACGYKAEWSRDSAHFPLIAVTG